MFDAVPSMSDAIAGEQRCTKFSCILIQRYTAGMEEWERIYLNIAGR